MGEISTIGLDIAKSVFQVHGVDDTCAVGSGEPVWVSALKVRVFDWDPIRAEH